MVIINIKKIVIGNLKILCLFLFIISTTSEVYAEEGYKRYGGSDRYETSMKISSNFNTKSGYAVLASGENFPDALCSCPLAKKYDAPILLTTEKQLDNKTEQQLKNYEVKKVFIIGKSISKSVEDKLSDMGIEFERIGGQDRFETATMVANYVGIKERIVVVSGENYPDALSIAPVAAIMDIPIILVSKNSMPKSVEDMLKDKNVTNTYIIGSQGAISDEVANEFKNSERIAGQDRFDTNMSIINRFSDVLDFSNLYIASGLNFPDSLSGSALAQKTKSPLILVSDDLNSNQQNAIKEILSKSTNKYVLGLNGAVSLKALYLIGLEKRPPEPPKPKGPQAPKWTSYFGVMNAGETTKVYIKNSPSSSASNIGYTYGSLPEVKVLEGSGNYYYVEVVDYNTLNPIKGYVEKSKVKTVTPTGPYNILVDKSKQRVYIFNGANVVKEYVCSTGTDETPTPSGRFLTGSKGYSFYASDSSICYFFTRIDNNYLFHSAIYDLNGYPIKSEYNKLGSKASHGCIRLPYNDAKWIYDNVPYGTLVTVI